MHLSLQVSLTALPLFGYWCPDLSMGSPSLEETFRILRSRHQPSRAMVTPNPWSHPHPDPSWTLPEMVTPSLPGSLPSWSSQNILGWIIGSSSSERHSQGSKPNPGFASTTWAHPKAWAFLQGENSWELASAGQGQHWDCCSCSLCHSLSPAPESCSASSVGSPLLLLTLYLCLDWCWVWHFEPLLNCVIIFFWPFLSFLGYFWTCPHRAPHLLFWPGVQM